MSGVSNQRDLGLAKLFNIQIDNDDNYKKTTKWKFANFLDNWGFLNRRVFRKILSIDPQQYETYRNVCKKAMPPSPSVTEKGLKHKIIKKGQAENSSKASQCSAPILGSSNASTDPSQTQSEASSELSQSAASPNSPVPSSSPIPSPTPQPPSPTADPSRTQGSASHAPDPIPGPLASDAPKQFPSPTAGKPESKPKDEVREAPKPMEAAGKQGLQGQKLDLPLESMWDCGGFEATVVNDAIKNWHENEHRAIGDYFFRKASSPKDNVQRYVLHVIDGGKTPLKFDFSFDNDKNRWLVDCSRLSIRKEKIDSLSIEKIQDFFAKTENTKNRNIKLETLVFPQSQLPSPAAPAPTPQASPPRTQSVPPPTSNPTPIPPVNLAFKQAQIPTTEEPESKEDANNGIEQELKEIIQDLPAGCVWDTTGLSKEQIQEATNTWKSSAKPGDYHFLKSRSKNNHYYLRIVDQPTNVLIIEIFKDKGKWKFKSTSPSISGNLQNLPISGLKKALNKAIKGRNFNIEIDLIKLSLPQSRPTQVSPQFTAASPDPQPLSQSSKGKEKVTDSPDSPEPIQNTPERELQEKIPGLPAGCVWDFGGKSPEEITKDIAAWENSKQRTPGDYFLSKASENDSYRLLVIGNNENFYIFHIERTVKKDNSFNWIISTEKPKSNKTHRIDILTFNELQTQLNIALNIGSKEKALNLTNPALPNPSDKDNPRQVSATPPHPQHEDNRKKELVHEGQRKVYVERPPRQGPGEARIRQEAAIPQPPISDTERIQNMFDGIPSTCIYSENNSEIINSDFKSWDSSPSRLPGDFFVRYSKSRGKAIIYIFTGAKNANGTNSLELVASKESNQIILEFRNNRGELVNIPNQNTNFKRLLSNLVESLNKACGIEYLVPSVPNAQPNEEGPPLPFVSMYGNFQSQLIPKIDPRACLLKEQLPEQVDNTYSGLYWIQFPTTKEGDYYLQASSPGVWNLYLCSVDNKKKKSLRHYIITANPDMPFSITEKTVVAETGEIILDKLDNLSPLPTDFITIQEALQNNFKGIKFTRIIVPKLINDQRYIEFAKHLQTRELIKRLAQDRAEKVQKAQTPSDKIISINISSFRFLIQDKKNSLKSDENNIPNRTEVIKRILEEQNLMRFIAEKEKYLDQSKLNVEVIKRNREELKKLAQEVLNFIAGTEVKTKNAAQKCLIPIHPDKLAETQLHSRFDLANALITILFE